MPRVKRPSWRRHDTAVSLGQGDLVLAAWAQTISPQEHGLSSAMHPTVGARDALDLRFWEDGPPGIAPPAVLEMWGRFNYSLAVVIAEGCAIDKEYTILRRRYEASGMDSVAAASRALDEADGLVTIAEAWPAEALPSHLQPEAESGAVGYVPFLLPGWVDDGRTYAVDLNRISTVSWRSLDQRIATAVDDPAWRQRLQTGLCRYFAARSIRISAELQEIFQEPILQVEAIGVPAGNPPRVRVRLHFESGRSQDLEAIQESVAAESAELDVGPGLQTRRRPI
jgi:hypothetical protein